MFQSVHSNLCEKNCLLYTLLQHGKHDHDHGGATADDTIAGVETTVDRSSKNNRIRNWINQVRQNLWKIGTVGIPYIAGSREE